MVEAIRYFTADYRNGRVYLGGKGKDAGYYAAQLLNECDKDEFAARLAVFRTENWNTAKQLRTGFLDTDTYIKAGDEIRYILTLLSKLRPFSELDIQGEHNRIEELFTGETAEQLCEYFRQRALTANMDFGYIFAGHFPKGYDKDFCMESEVLLQTVLATLDFYDRLGDDVGNAAKKLRQFVKRTGEAERLDEEHLLPIAIEIFGSAPFDVTTEYVPIRKSSRSKTATVARRLHFKSYYSFVLTDFFEGLQNGHYTYQQERGFDVAQDVARNEAVGQFTNMGVGLGTMAGVGGAVGGVVGGAINGAFAGINNSVPSQPATLFCDQCGAELTPGAAFCDNCGAPQSSPDTCSKCGFKFIKPGKFCPKCGAKREG